ncbi:MAG: MerR family DNA-binding protein, partial [Spirochaetes bacterium]|nr:MerR family DNA-binding protein [Spirochaetota bacterium]
LAIKELKKLGFSLKEIKDIINHVDKEEDLLIYCKEKAKVIDEQIDHYRKLRKRLSGFMKSIREEEMTEEETRITIKQISDIGIVSTRYHGKYSDSGKYFGELFKVYGRFVNSRPFNLYWDNEYMEDDADIESCVPVKKSGLVRNKGDGLKFRQLEGGQFVTVLHRGSYESIGRSYRAVIDYCRIHRLSVILPTREIYHKGPGLIIRGNPNNYITEIQICVKES